MKIIASLILAFALAILPVGGGIFSQTADASVLSYSGHPTIFIVSVDRDTSVTIRARNLPPDYEFRVRMGRMGTRGIRGTIVDTFDTGDGGSQTLTFDIPSRFHGDRQIAIRIEAYDRTGLLSEITNVVAENKVNILAANVTTSPDHTATVRATLRPPEEASDAALDHGRAALGALAA